MIRKFGLLVAMVVAALAVMAPSANAEGPVHVENADAVSIEGNTIALFAHVAGVGEVKQLECTNHWEGSVSESGAIDLPIVDIDPPGVGNCAGADDCAGAGWGGQIVEGEGSHEYEVDFEFCLNGLGFPLVVTCEITDNHAICDDADAYTEPGVLTQFEVDGEISFHNPISISHG